MVPDPKSVKPKTEEKQARQNPRRTQDIPLLFQRDAGTSSLDEDAGKL